MLITLTAAGHVRRLIDPYGPPVCPTPGTLGPVSTSEFGTLSGGGGGVTTSHANSSHNANINNKTDHMHNAHSTHNTHTHNAHDAHNAHTAHTNDDQEQYNLSLPSLSRPSPPSLSLPLLLLRDWDDEGTEE